MTPTRSWLTVIFFYVLACGISWSAYANASPTSGGAAMDLMKDPRKLVAKVGPSLAGLLILLFTRIGRLTAADAPVRCRVQHLGTVAPSGTGGQTRGGLGRSIPADHFAAPHLQPFLLPDERLGCRDVLLHGAINGWADFVENRRCRHWTTTLRGRADGFSCTAPLLPSSAGRW